MKWHIKPIMALLMATIISACSTTQPTTEKSNNIESPTSTQVEIAKETLVALPQPNQLGYDLTASQFLNVQYIDSQQTTQQHQLPIQLQVSQNKVVLAGFSSWGTRLLSLTYQDNQIETYVMSGLGNTLPKPDQVLFNLMITLWPLDVWQPHLHAIGWQLKQKQTDTKRQRQLINEQGQLMAEINYASVNPLKGDITFINHAFDFTIVIKTLQYQQVNDSISLTSDHR